MPNFRTYVRFSREIIRAKKNSVNRFFQKTPAVGNSRGCAGQVAHRVFFFPASRTPAAGSVCVPHAGLLFSRAGKKPAPAAGTPAVGNSRGCAGQVAHRVFFFPASRTPAAGSGCAPTLSFYFPGQGESPPPVPCGREETRRAKAPAHPPRTETPEKLSFAPWLFGRFPYQPAVCGPKGR